MFVVCVCSCMCMGGKGTKFMHVKSITCNAARMCVYMSLSVVFAMCTPWKFAMPWGRRLYFKYISIYIYLFLLYFQNTQLSMAPLKGGAQGRGRPLHPLRVTPLGWHTGREAGPTVATGNTSLQDVMSQRMGGAISEASLP